MTARTDAAARHEIKSVVVLELDRDQCQNTYGASPCTAGITHSGTAQAGSTATTINLAAGASAVDDAYNTQTVRITGGLLSGFERVISDYNGTTKVATVSSAWPSNLVQRSDELDNAYWFNSGCVITANADGVAETLTDDSAVANEHVRKSALALTVGAAYVWSIKVKKDATPKATRYVALRLDFTGSTAQNAAIRVDTSTGESAGGGANLLGSGCEDSGDYWRIWVIGRTNDAACTGIQAVIFPSLGAGATLSSANDNVATTGSATFKNVQLEQADRIGDYVATTSAAITAPDATSTYAVINRAAACYYSYGNCQDKANYNRGTQTDRFCSRGMAAPAGVTMRPYVTALDSTPTEIVPGKGLSMRGTTSVSLTDEPCPDHLEDRHAATRAVAAAGTFWGRYMARHRHLVGRMARVRRGYLVEPFDWATFQTELYTITAVSGPDNAGRMKITLQDPIKLLDAVKIPAPSSGKLAADMAGVSHTGVVVSATSTTVVLPSTGNNAASAVDDFYNGQEIWIYANTGAGQRRTITDYVGSTRTATVAAWSVNPDSTSSYEISPLSLTLATGGGSGYTDPATSGKAEFVRVGKEIIRYTAKSGDTLSWPDATYREQFGSAREDHKADDLVQLCRAFVGQTPAAVIEALHNEGGITDTYIDLTGLAAECTQWLSSLTITACLSAPEAISTVLSDLLVDLAMVEWWDAVAQQVKFKVNMPEISSSVGELTDDDLALGSAQVAPMDKDRITSQAIYYGLADATADRRQNANYLRGKGYVDAAAKSANEYADDRPAVRQSYWLGTANDNHATAWCGRQVARLRDAPSKISFKVLPRNEQRIGALVNVRLRAKVDETGQPKTLLVRVVKIDQAGGQQDVTCLTTGFGKRYAFIAPTGQPDYTAASEAQRAYAYIATTATQKMGNGDDPYLIV